MTYLIDDRLPVRNIAPSKSISIIDPDYDDISPLELGKLWCIDDGHDDWEARLCSVF